MLLAGAGLLMAVTQGVWSYASVLGHGHTSMSASALSAVLAISSVVALAGAVAGPLAVKRFGRLRSMTGFVAVEALSTGLLIVTHSPTLFIATAVIWQTCWLAVLVQILAAASVIDSTGRWVAALSGAGALGGGIGPLAIGAIMDNMGVGVLSILLTAGTLIAALPLLKMTASSDAAADTASASPHPQAMPIARTAHRETSLTSGMKHPPHGASTAAESWPVCFNARRDTAEPGLMLPGPPPGRENGERPARCGGHARQGARDQQGCGPDGGDHSEPLHKSGRWWRDLPTGIRPPWY